MDDPIELAALADSALRFRRAAVDAMDSLLCEMIAQRLSIAGAEFKTQGSWKCLTQAGRPCLVVLCIGQTAVEQGLQAVEDMNKELDKI